MIRSVWARTDEGAGSSLTALGYASMNFPNWTKYAELAAKEAPAVSGGEFDAASTARRLDREMFGRCVKAVAEKLMATALRGGRAFRALVVPPEDFGKDERNNPVLLGYCGELQKFIESCPNLGTVLMPIDEGKVFPRVGLYVYLRG